MRRSSFLAALCCCCVAAQPGELQRFEAAEPHMGTLFRVVLYAPDADTARRGFERAFARVAALDRMMSDYDPASEIMRACAMADRAPVRVSADLFTVLQAGQELARDTGGAFDITVGPLTALWRAARKEKRVPDAEPIAEARARTGYRKVRLDATARTLSLAQAGMRIDLGGIAKGYAADQALAALRDMGITRALVAASGDIVAGDAPPGEDGWRVGVDSFAARGNAFARVLRVHNEAVSTSGDTEQFVVAAGKRYSHIIDPRTGYGLTRRIEVTVRARVGILADPLATAVSVTGADAGLRYVETRGHVAAFVTTEAGVRESARWRSAELQ